VGLDRRGGLVGNHAGWRMQVRTATHGSGHLRQGFAWVCRRGGAGRGARSVAARQWTGTV